MHRRRKLLAALALGTATIAGAAVVATAATSGAGSDPNQVYACVKNGDGSVRLVAVGEACKNGETLRSWSITGSAGRDGKDGSSGAPHTAAVGRLQIKGQKQGPFLHSPYSALGYSFGVTSPRDASSGQPTGRRQYKPLVVDLGVGQADAQLIQALATNENLPTVTYEVLRADGTVATRYTLTNASLTDLGESDQGIAGIGPVAEASFGFQKIKVEVLKSDGTVESETEDDANQVS